MLAWTQLKEPGPALLILVIISVSAQVVNGAPLDDLEQQSSEIEYYPVADATGCYYNFEHYDEGDRIITNEPCLNCTCHNRMLMCYLRVCPFTKAIGQDCKVEKKADQCCPVITCPEVPVHLLSHTSTTPSTAVGHVNEYGCSIDNLFYADGAKVPSNPNNPCEVCYCIRNKTACIIQECTLTGKVVEGCRPVYVDGVCCPVRYDCDHPELETTPRPLLTTTTTTLPPTTAPTDCIYNNEVYADGALVKKDVPCEQCYCMRGDIVCAVQECGPTPLDKVNCTALPAKEGQCCPDTYECENISEEDLTTLTYYEAPTTQPTEILPNDTSTLSEIEGPTTTIQGKEPSAEEQVTELIAQGTEDIGAAQPVTESATIESFTSRITEAVEAITTKVTEIVEAITSTVSRSDQETTVQPETQTAGLEVSIATEKSETTDQQVVTEGEVEKETKPEIVTETLGQETVTLESEGPRTTVSESATEAFEIPVHDDNEEESHHEEEHDIEGSGKPEEEQQPIPSVTATPETEGKYTRPDDQQQTESGLTTTEKVKEVTEEGSGAPEEQTSILPVEPETTSQPDVEIVSTEHEESLQTLEPESYVKGTVPPQAITEETITKKTIEPVEEKQGTPEPPVTDAEAQETVQPLEPERGTEQTKPETPVTTETIIGEQEQTAHDITQVPEEITKEITTEQPKETLSVTDESENKLNELIPSVEESPTTVKSDELVTSITEEPIKESEQEATTSPEEQKLTDVEQVEQESTTSPEEQKVTGVEEGEPIATTEKELEFITETTAKETERPESMDHVSETSEPETEAQVTEKIIEKEAAEKGIDTTETEKTTETPELNESTGVPKLPEIPADCGDKDCKNTQDENEIPIQVEESCTKESCKPQEQVPSSETGTTLPVVCESEHGCVPSPPQEESKTPEDSIPDLLEKETPAGEECKDEQGCLPAVPGKESEIIDIEKATEHYPPICDKDSGCVPEDGSKQTATVTPAESPELTTQTTVDEKATTIQSEEQPLSETEQPVSETGQPVSETEQPERITEQPERITEHSEGITKQPEIITEKLENITEQPETVEGSGEETTEFSGHGITPEEYESTSPSLKPESQTEKETEKEPGHSTEGEIIETQTTVQPDVEQQTEIGAGPERITPISEEVTSKEYVTPEIPKEESDLSVSPISPDVTEAPISTQKVEISSYTELPEQEQDILTESVIHETTEQTETKETQPTETYPVKTEIAAETTPSIEKITPETVPSEATTITAIPSVTEIGVTQSVSDITQATPSIQDGQTTESGELPQGQEGEETIPQVPGTTDEISVDSAITESAKSVTESQPPEDTKISESTPSLEITITEKTELPEQESESTEASISKEPQGPEETPEVFATTEQSSSEGTKVSDETLPHEPEVPQTTSSILSELPESTEKVLSERTSTEISQGPVGTEVPISPVETETEIAPQSEGEHGIPGEGSCLVDGQTYKNNSYVPPINQCQTSCKCLSSILQCESVPCTPPPSNLQCAPIFHSPDACCPVYSCSVPGVTSMESDSHVVETTTVGEENLATQVSPKEEIGTSVIVTEKVLSITTVKPEAITEGQSEIRPKEPVTETKITEHLPVKPTDATVSGETTEPSSSQITTQKEVVTETEAAVSVTEFESKETPVPETQTIISDKETTIASESVTSTPVFKPIEEHIPSQDDIENEIIEEPIHPDHCGSDGCALTESTKETQEEVTALPEVSQPLEPEAPKEPEVKDQVVTETEEKLLETTVASVTEQPQKEISEQTEVSLPGTTESGIPKEPAEGETEVSVTQPQEGIPEHTESTSEKEEILPGITETIIPERPTERETEVSVTQPPEDVSEHTEGTKSSDKEEEEVPSAITESAVPEKPIEEETEIPVTQQPQEEIPEHPESITTSDKESILPDTTESIVPEQQTEKETETSVTEQPQEEIPEQTEIIKTSDKEGALPATTENVVPVEGETVASLTEKPQEEISDETPEKASILPETTESVVPIEEQTEVSATEKPQDKVSATEEPQDKVSATEEPQDKVPEQTESVKISDEEGTLPGITETAVPEIPAEGETELSVTEKPQEEIPEQTEGIKISDGSLPFTTESVLEKQTEKGTETSITEQPQDEVSEQTEAIKTSDKDTTLSGTTVSIATERPIEKETEVSVTQTPQQEIPEQTEGITPPEKEFTLPDTTQSVISEGPVEEEIETALTEQPQEIPEQTEGIKASDKEEVLPGTTESAVPEKPIEEETQQPLEEIPEQTEITKSSDKEDALPDTTPAVVPEGHTEGETEVSITEQPQEIPEQTEGLKTPEEEGALPGTTERVTPEKPIEVETEISKTEQPESAEPITVQDLVTDSFGLETSPETVTSSEESSKTPEEIAAVPEIEEAVTTPSVLTITETIQSEVSPKVSEQTTISAEAELETTSEKRPEIVETDQTTVSQEAKLTVKPQFEDSSAPTIEGSTGELETPYQTTLPSAAPVDHIGTTQSSVTVTPKFEGITESDDIDTTLGLETEAQVTVKSDQESEKGKDVTGPPVTEVVPEITTKQMLEPVTTKLSQTEIPQGIITEQIPTTVQQPSKPIDLESEGLPTEKLTTSVSEITEPTTVKYDETEVDITEKVTVAEKESEAPATESEQQEIGEFPTHAPTVTGIKEDTTDTPVITEEIQPAKSTEDLLSSKPTEQTLLEGDGVTVTEKEAPIYTSPQITTQNPLNISALYTSGLPQVEISTKKYVEGQLSTSVPAIQVTTSESSTSAPTYAPPPASEHDIPGEQVPELPDYHSQAEDYEDEDQGPLGPGTCRYGGKVYVSAQQIPRDDPCDFCFCFRSDIICLQQSCPPPIPRCHEEPIRGFCCPRYECPVGMATSVNVTTSTTTTTTTLPPHFFSHAYKGRVSKSGCQIKGRAYQVGDVIPSASGPCLQCTCGGDGEMKCDPKACSPEPMLRQMIAAAASRRRR